MKKLLKLFLLLVTSYSYCQSSTTSKPISNLIYQNIFADRLKIGGTGTSIESSALGEFNSTTKGLLIPRMTNAQMLAIQNAKNGLIVYNTDNQCLYVRSSSDWINVCANLSNAQINWNTITSKPPVITNIQSELDGKASLTGSYSNPTWITSLANSKITGLGSIALLNSINLASNVTGLLPDANITSASNWNNKQAALNGTGFVKATGSTISYDNTTYAPISSPTIVNDITSPLFKISGAGDIGNGSLVMSGNSNDLTLHGTGKVILGTGGFQRLVVTNAGNVGIGTTAPQTKFEISGTNSLRYNDGNQSDGKYMRSNTSGVASWNAIQHNEIAGLSSNYLQKTNPIVNGKLTIQQYVDENNEIQLPKLRIGTTSSANSVLKSIGTNGEYEEGFVNADEVVGLAGVYALGANVNLNLDKKLNIENGVAKGTLSIQPYTDENNELKDAILKIGTSNDANTVLKATGVNGEYSHGFVNANEIVGISNYAGLSSNNNFIGSNLFLTPIFANSTSTSAFSSITGVWSNTGNLGVFSFRYNTKVGASTVTWNPIRLDANGWVGIGMNPTQAFEVFGASKFNSAITATSIVASGNIISNATIKSLDSSIDSNYPVSTYFLNTVAKYYQGIANGNNVLITGSASGDIIHRTTGGKMLFSTDNGASSALTILNNGNLGIGGSPSERLHVVGNILTNQKIGFNNDATNYYISSISNGMQYSPFSVGNFTFSSGSGNWNFTNGNVGIGTATADRKLVVDGQIGFSYGDGGSYVGLSSTADKLGLQFFAGVTSNESNNSYRFLNSIGQNIFIIQNGGNTGIGTITPEQKLHVEGLIKIKSYTTAEINAMTGMTVGTITMNSTIGLPVFYNGTGWKRFDGSNM